MAYTYLIGWSKHNKFYYGARWAKDCDPVDLWKTYFTSSMYVKEYRTQFGEPDIIQIRKTFTDVAKCRVYEHTVLRRLKVLSNDKWLNKNVNGQFLPYGPQTPTHISNKRQSLLEYYNNGGQAWSLGLTKETDDRLEKIAKSISSALTGMPKSDSHKKAMALRPQNASLTCPHCDKTGDYRNMKRWHFDNCKTLGKERKKYNCPHCLEDGVLPNIMLYHFDNCKLIPKIGIITSE